MPAAPQPASTGDTGHAGCTSYTGRFAPSPTGPLHAGSLVAALASWLDARAHGGRWLVRIEDVDTPRCLPGTAQIILSQLAACGLVPDEAPLAQSARGALYQQALDTLLGQGLAYPCACSRKDIEGALAATGTARPRHGELVYPGTCRAGLRGRPARAWRLRVDGEGNVDPMDGAGVTDGADSTGSTRSTDSADGTHRAASTLVHWHDRRLGAQQQDVARAVGDFVLRRADGLWAYQLAVVVDDAAQGVSHVVRGEDLADNTARQILLQRALGLPTPRYLHTPLVLGANGEKLSKQNGATALDLAQPLQALRQAGRVLGIGLADGGTDTAAATDAAAGASSVGDWLARAVAQWRSLYPR